MGRYGCLQVQGSCCRSLWATWADVKSHPPVFPPARRDLVPLGQVKSNFNYSVDDKRVLNFENIVNE